MTPTPFPSPRVQPQPLPPLPGSQPEPRGLEGWRNRFGQFALSIMLVPPWQRRIVAGTKAGSQVVFQFMSITIGAVTFAASTVAFAWGLLGYGLLQSLLIGGWAALGLWLLDRYTVVDRRGNPQAGWGKTLVVRVVSLTLLLGVGLLAGVTNHHADIERIQAQRIRASAQALQADPRYAPQVQAAEQALAQAQRDMQRRAELDRQISAQGEIQNHAEAERQRECAGTTDPRSGLRRHEGCGPLATHWTTERDEAARQVLTLSNERATLGDPQVRSLQAQQTLTTLQAQIGQESKVSQKGAAQRVDGLLELLLTEWSARFTMLLWLLIGLINEMLVLIALARNPAVDAAFVPLNQLEQRRILGEIMLAAQQFKQQLAQRSAPLQVRLGAAVLAPANDPSQVPPAQAPAVPLRSRAWADERHTASR